MTLSSSPDTRADFEARPSRISTGRLGPPRDYGQLLARGLCALFAVVGLLPLVAILAARAEPLREWAARESAALLKQLTGLEASYQVRLETWPLGLELTDVIVQATDGGPPALVAPRLSVTPRVFSLLAGRIDVGHIALEEPAIRLRIEDGALTNVALELPESEGSSRAPFTSIAVTDARVVASVDGVALDSAPIDLDVFAEADGSLEVALRAARTSIVREREVLPTQDGVTGASPSLEPFLALDEDTICQLDARVRLGPEQLLVHRLSVAAAVDEDPAPGTQKSCGLEVLQDSEQRVLARISGLQVMHPGGVLTHAAGHVLLSAPLEVLGRHLPALELSGWVGVSGDVQYHAGAPLPDFHGKIRSGRIGLKDYLIVDGAEADVHLVGERIVVPTLRAGYADGDVLLEGLSVDLSQPSLPLVLERARATGLTFPGLMRDVDVTPDTIVNWDLKHVAIDDFSGTLDPPHLEGRLAAETENFEVFDRAFHAPKRRHMIGVRRAQVNGFFGVEPDSVRFRDIVATFGKSRLLTSVSIAFDNTIALSVPKGSVIDLADASPLVDIPMSGLAALDIEMKGKMADPLLVGGLSVDDLVFAGFPLGDVERSKLRFRPLEVELEDVSARKGSSAYHISRASLDFGTSATLVADASVRAPEMNVRDFFAMWHFDDDPRWAGVIGEGATEARVRYVLGGPQDRCGTGDLRVRGALDLRALTVFDERYERARSSFDFHWSDIDASYLGMTFDLPNLEITKGSGSLLGSARIQKNGVVGGRLVITGVPIASVQGLGALAQSAIGSIDGTAALSGTLDALRASADVNVTPVRIGRARLPASRLHVDLEPIERPLASLGNTACGARRPAPFDPGEYAQDLAAGVFRTNGELFGGQIRLHDVSVTRQRDKRVQGTIDLVGLDLAALGNLSPRVALLDPQPRATLDAKLVIDELLLAAPGRAKGSLAVERLAGEYRGVELATQAPARLTLGGGALELPNVTLRATARGGHRASFDVNGRVLSLDAEPRLDLRTRLMPVQLAGLASLVPSAERLEGAFRGELSVEGPLSAPVYHGGFELTDGGVQLRGATQGLSELDVRLDVRPGELSIERGAFAYGGGRVTFNGTAPLLGFRLGELRALIDVEDVSLPLAQGVHAKVDAELRATWQPGRAPDRLDKPNLPRVVGSVVLDEFEYSRPVRMSANITDLAQRGRRTEFESYQPEGDFVVFDVSVRSPRPLVLRNNLIDAKLSVEGGALELAGTNQRFGARGALRIEPGGRIHLRQNEFEIQQGQVRFDDPTRIAPLVDVTAVTDYRRYASGLDTGTSGAPPTATAQSSSNSTAGQWRVTMHAHGDAETLRVDLSSQPELSQDDIFLLLTFGLTRAELDQAYLTQSQSASLGESVALEALGTLTGADKAVTEAIPVIDEFRFGSAYSARAGRTEPTITIGKRLSERIRAFVTSGITEAREVRSNVEVKINNQMSVQGSYDNVNDISSSSLGNLGADIRWRLDFE